MSNIRNDVKIINLILFSIIQSHSYWRGTAPSQIPPVRPEHLANSPTRSRAGFSSAPETRWEAARTGAAPPRGHFQHSPRGTVCSPVTVRGIILHFYRKRRNLIVERFIWTFLAVVSFRLAPSPPPLKYQAMFVRFSVWEPLVISLFWLTFFRSSFVRPMSWLLLTLIFSIPSLWMHCKF